MPSSASETYIMTQELGHDRQRKNLADGFMLEDGLLMEWFRQRNELTTLHTRDLFMERSRGRS